MRLRVSGRRVSVLKHEDDTPKRWVFTLPYVFLGVVIVLVAVTGWRNNVDGRDARAKLSAATVELRSSQARQAEVQRDSFRIACAAENNGRQGTARAFERIADYIDAAPPDADRQAFTVTLRTIVAEELAERPCRLPTGGP